MQNYYQFIIPRLNGREIKKDFSQYLSLVKKGVAGFIVFGGELEQIRKKIKKLQEEAEFPLIIAADLEQGLGQQINGGTLFPPAMAIASAIRKGWKSASSGSSKRRDESLRNMENKESRLLKDIFKAIASEARYAGINTILAPVLDINTNPKNPIISVRAFGDQSDAVTFFGTEMIKTVQGQGLATCGKHFPGHGDTKEDSHIRLPTVKKKLNALSRCELRPFQKAIEAEVKMLMLGHLNVAAIDPSGIPISISEKAVGFLREKMKYNGILITDAINMGGLGGYSEERAALMALAAGVDIILHPTDSEKIVSYLMRKNVVFNESRLSQFRKGLLRGSTAHTPDFDKHSRLSQDLAEKAIKISGDFKVNGKPFLVILSDEDNEKGNIFTLRLKNAFRNLKSQILIRNSVIQKISLPDNAFVIVAVFSETKAWKGGPSRWLNNQVLSLQDRADVIISFGSPFLLENIKNTTKIFAYWDSESAQNASAQIIKDKR